MCFSATASFTLGAILVPLGAYTVSRAAASDRRWLGFAAFPLAFGIQQIIEGFVWLGLEGGNPGMEAAAARGFLFFSHFFWLAFVPVAVLLVEPEAWRRRLLKALAVVGFAYGLSIFLPSFVFADWLAVEKINQSLEYKTTLIYDGHVNRTVLRLFYAAIILGALFLSSHRHVIIFAILILVSLLGTYLFFAYAFISVWCFFAAALSAYLTHVIVRQQQWVPQHGD